MCVNATFLSISTPLLPKFADLHCGISFKVYISFLLIITLKVNAESKAENLKNLFNEINVVEWGDLPKFDMIINATTLGLNKVDKFGINFSQAGQNKLFYDVIYAPFQTEFSEAGNAEGNSIENGLNMFLFQGQQAFNIWHNVEPVSYTHLTLPTKA